MSSRVGIHEVKGFANEIFFIEQTRLQGDLKETFKAVTGLDPEDQFRKIVILIIVTVREDSRLQSEL